MSMNPSVRMEKGTAKADGTLGTPHSESKEEWALW